MKTTRSTKNLRLRLALAVGTLAAVSGCGSDISVTGLASDDASGSFDLSSNACHTSIVDYGVHGTVAAAATLQRGQFSAVAVIPGTTNPAIAYVDGTYGATGAGANVIKFRYYNGSAWVQELLAPAGVVRNIRMAFLSTGFPIVMWSEGSQEGAATNWVGRLRFASRNSALSSASYSTSAWTVSQVYSATAAATAWPEFAGIDIKVSPSDQVLVTYIGTSGNTLVTSARSPRVALCSSSCEQFTNYSFKLSTPLTATDNMVAAGGSTVIPNNNFTIPGLPAVGGWCNNGTAYVPAILYNSAATTSVYAVCNQSTLSNCMTMTNWVANAVNTPGGNIVAQDMIIDPAVANDLPKLAYGTSTGIRTVTMTGASCSAPTGYSAAALVNATANLGQNGILRAFKDTSNGGTFHLVFNSTNASINYINTVGTASPTVWNLVASWNTTLGTVENPGAFVNQNAPLAAQVAAGLNMNADIVTASGSGSIFFTYPVGNSVTVSPYQLRLLRITSLLAASTSPAVNPQSPDTTGNLSVPLASAAPTSNRPLQVSHTASGIPAVAYTDFSASNSVAGAQGQLKFAVRASTDGTSAWGTTTIASNGQKVYPALYYPPSGNIPYVSAYDAATNQFVLYKGANTQGTSFSQYSFPTIPGTIAAPVAPATNESCLTHWTNGGTEYIVMAVVMSSTITVTTTYQRTLFSARFNPSTNTFSTFSTTIAAMGAGGGNSISCVTDSSGNIGVAYVDITGANARYISSNNGGTTWQAAPVNVGTAGAGLGATLTLNPTTEAPAMAYYEPTTGNVYGATCNGTVFTCATSASWSQVTGAPAVGTVNMVGTTANVNGMILKANYVFDSAANRYLIYTAGPSLGANAHLMYTKYNSSTGVFGASTVLVPGINIDNTVSYTPAYASPYAVHALRSPLGHLTMGYIAPGNYLGVTTCGD